MAHFLVHRVGILGIWLFFMLSSGLCYGENMTVNVVGSLKCTGCSRNEVNSDMTSGLYLTISCKSSNGESNRGEGSVTKDGKFEITLMSKISGNVTSTEKCLAKIRDGSGAPCSAATARTAWVKIYKYEDNKRKTSKHMQKLKFSPECTSAFFLPPFFKCPPASYSPPPNENDSPPSETLPAPAPDHTDPSPPAMPPSYNSPVPTPPPMSSMPAPVSNDPPSVSAPPTFSVPAPVSNDPSSAPAPPTYSVPAPVSNDPPSIPAPPTFSVPAPVSNDPPSVPAPPTVFVPAPGSICPTSSPVESVPPQLPPVAKDPAHSSRPSSSKTPKPSIGKHYSPPPKAPKTFISPTIAPATPTPVAVPPPFVTTTPPQLPIPPPYGRSSSRIPRAPPVPNLPPTPNVPRKYFNPPKSKAQPPQHSH